MRAPVTPAGEALVQRARTLLRDVDELVEAARAHTRPLSGRLPLGAIPTVAPYLLLLALEAPLGDAESLALFRDDFVRAAPPGHRLARRRRIREADLEREAVLLLEDGHCLREQALAVCGAADYRELGERIRHVVPRGLISLPSGGRWKSKADPAT